MSILALALGFGLALSGVQADAMAGKMIATAGADTPMSDGCDGCADEDGMSLGACATACIGINPAALPDAASLPALLRARFGVAATFGGDGRIGSPDPYPPRPSILG